MKIRAGSSAFRVEQARYQPRLTVIGLAMRTDVSGNAVSKSKRVPESRVTKKSVKLPAYLVFTVTEFIGV